MMKSKWLIVVLVVSLAANLLLAGYLLGQGSQPRFTGDPTRMFPRWVRTLPEARQQELRPSVREHLRAMRKPVRGMRRQQQALQSAITAEPFDATALTAVLAQLRTQNQQAQQASHLAFVKFVTELTAAERQALVTDLRTPTSPRWRPPRHPQ